MVVHDPLVAYTILPDNLVQCLSSIHIVFPRLSHICIVWKEMDYQMLLFLLHNIRFLTCTLRNWMNIWTGLWMILKLVPSCWSLDYLRRIYRVVYKLVSCRRTGYVHILWFRPSAIHFSLLSWKMSWNCQNLNWKGLLKTVSNVEKTFKVVWRMLVILFHFLRKCT